MRKEISLDIERLSGEQEEECCITSARQIQSLLRNVVEAKSRAALYYGGTTDFIMTSLLNVGDKGLWVEHGTDISRNRRIAESRNITLVSSLDRVKIQFAVTGARLVTHQGDPAFYLPLPANLYRLQRRQHFRLAIPSSERLRCVIPTGMRGRVEMPITDISGGGLRLSCVEGNIEFVPGQTYPDCQIDLPGVGKISVTITVKSLIPHKHEKTAGYIGCEFKDIDNAYSTLLQNYVTKMQCLLKRNADD